MATCHLRHKIRMQQLYFLREFLTRGYRIHCLQQSFYIASFRKMRSTKGRASQNRWFATLFFQPKSALALAEACQCAGALPIELIELLDCGNSSEKFYRFPKTLSSSINAQQKILKKSWEKNLGCKLPVRKVPCALTACASTLLFLPSSW